MSILQTTELKKYYGAEPNITRALDGVTLSIEKGEFVAIVGTSGSGKSTLLNQLAGLEKPTRGTVKIKGELISKMSEKQLAVFRQKHIGFVFQSYNLIAELTVQENIRVVADIAEHPLALAELMEDLGLSRHAKHFPSELSGGQQQRCAIGRALIKNPAILLCDEPTGALDSASAREVLAILEQINRKYHTTVIIITHNEAVAGMADRVIRLHDGKVKSNTENEKVRIEELDI